MPATDPGLLGAALRTKDRTTSTDLPAEHGRACIDALHAVVRRSRRHRRARARGRPRRRRPLRDDDGELERAVPSAWPERIEVLARHAGRCLESLTVSAAAGPAAGQLPAKAASSRREQHGRRGRAALCAIAGLRDQALSRRRSSTRAGRPAICSAAARSDRTRRTAVRREGVPGDSRATPITSSRSWCGRWPTAIACFSDSPRDRLRARRCVGRGGRRDATAAGLGRASIATLARGLRRSPPSPMPLDADRHCASSAAARGCGRVAGARRAGRPRR